MQCLYCFEKNFRTHEYEAGGEMEEQVKTGGSSSMLSRLTGNLGIRGKILLGFMAILALTAIIAAVALVGQRYSNTTVDQMVNTHNRAALLSLEAQGHVGDMFQQDALFRRTILSLACRPPKINFCRNLSKRQPVPRKRSPP